MSIDLDVYEVEKAVEDTPPTMAEIPPKQKNGKEFFQKFHLPKTTKVLTPKKNDSPRIVENAPNKIIAALQEGDTKYAEAVSKLADNVGELANAICKNTEAFQEVMKNQHTQMMLLMELLSNNLKCTNNV